MTLAADPVFREGGGAGEGGGRSSAGKLRVGLRDRVSKLLCAGAGAVRSSQHMFEGPSSADRWPLPDPTAESRSQPSNDPRRAIPAQGGRGQAHVAEEQLQLLEASTERANSGREAGSRSDREGYARTRLDERRATVMRDSSSAYGSLRGMSFLDSEEELEQVLGDLVGQIRNGSPMQQAAAVERLFNTVADSDPARQVVSQLGAVPGLIGLLQTGSDPSKMYAAYTLSSLTSLSLSRNQMIEMSVAGHLVELLKTCPLMVAKKGAMRALGRLGRDPKAAQQVVNAGALPLIISLLSNEDSSLVRRCLIALYFIGSDKEPLQVEICKAGALLQCMGLCSSQEADVQTEAVEVVKMLFRCPLAHAQLLREAPEVLGTLRNAALNGNSSRTRSSAAKALSRLENSGSAELRSMVMAVSNGAHPPTQAGAREQEASADMDMMRQLTAIITRGNSQLRAQAAQAVMDVAAEDLSASRELAECGIVGPLIELVIHGNSDGRLYAASALAKMALEPTVLESIFQDGAVPPLLDCLLDHRTQEGAAAALELLASHPEAAFSMVAEGAVPRLVDCLERPSSDAALLSAARSLFILACADGGVLPQVVRSRGVEIMIQCCWRSCLAVQGVVLAMLQQLALQPAYQHDCCIHGMIGLLMWLARSNFPSEVEDVANESLAELSRSTQCSRAVQLEMTLQSSISSMISEVVGHGAPVSPQTEQAFCTIPRGMFAKDAHKQAYVNGRLCLKSLGLDINPAHVDAMMLESLCLEPGQTVMDVGSGSGFVTAMMAFIVGRLGHVTGVEVNEAAAFHAESCIENVMEHRHLPDLRVDFLLRNAAALRSSISFDRILVGGDCSEDLLLDMFYRLNPGGIMVAPCQGNLLRIYKDRGLHEMELLGTVSLPSLLAHTEPQTAKANHHENIGAIELDGEALDSQVQQWGGDGGIAVPAQASGNPAQGQQVPAVESLGQRASPGGSGDDDPGGALCRDDIQICLTAEGRKCRLGEGGFGVVYKALMNGVDEVAVKLVKAANPSEKDMEQFTMEVRVLRNLHHRNIVQFYGACLEPGSLFFVTELMKGGDLYTALRHHPETMRWDRLGRKVALDIALGMNYLHNRKAPMMHRDLKSPNVLLSEEGVAKIADVGMVRTQVENLVTAQPVMTPLWAAPEVIRHERASTKADIWSYGVLIWEIVTQKDITEFQPLAIARQMRTTKSLQLPPDAPPVAARLFWECTEMDPEARPTAAKIVEILRQDRS